MERFEQFVLGLAHGAQEPILVLEQLHEKKARRDEAEVVGGIKPVAEVAPAAGERAESDVRVHDDAALTHRLRGRQRAG